MTEPQEQPAAPAVAPDTGAGSPSQSLNPSLSASLRADYEALRNDVQQANELAAEFQRQLAGKSNECADFKRLFEKTQTDLQHLQAGINELRQERHRLANEAMRATAFERKYLEVASDRDRLRIEMNAMRQALAAGAEELVRHLRDSHTQVARLTIEIEKLKQELAVRSAAVEPAAIVRSPPAAELKSQGTNAELDAFIEISFNP